MLQSRGQVGLNGHDIIEDSAYFSPDEAEENSRQLRVRILRPIEEPSSAHRIGGQQHPGPIDVTQHGGGPLIAYLREKRHPPDGAVVAVQQWRRLGALGRHLSMSWHNTSHRMREGPDGPQIRGLMGGLLQKANRPAQDETSSSRLGEADTDLVEHVERREPGGIIPELRPQDAALRQVSPQPRRRRIIRRCPPPRFAGSLSPQRGPLPEALGLRPGLGRNKNQCPLALRPVQVVAEIGPGLVDTDGGDALARCHVSHSSS